MDWNASPIDEKLFGEEFLFKIKESSTDKLVKSLARPAAQIFRSTQQGTKPQIKVVQENRRDPRQENNQYASNGKGQRPCIKQNPRRDHCVDIGRSKICRKTEGFCKYMVYFYWRRYDFRGYCRV